MTQLRYKNSFGGGGQSQLLKKVFGFYVSRNDGCAFNHDHNSSSHGTCNDNQNVGE